MKRSLAVATFLLVVPLVAGAVIEPKTKTEYPDLVTITQGGRSLDLRATGVALREKTFMKVDVYTIVSYVSADVELGLDPAATLREIDAPKRIQMDLRRGFGRDKLLKSFEEVIARNYDDRSAFAADLETFLAYFVQDAEENDKLVFEYLPGVGLTTLLNDELKGTITNPAFVEALWTVWFGEKPADGGMREDLVSAFSS